MDFYTELEKRGYSDLLVKKKYVQPVYSSLDRVLDFLSRIVTEEKSVFVYGDYDVDGCMSAKIISRGLEMVGVKRVGIFNYQERTHSLDPIAVQQCVQGQYDCCIVCDTGSSDMSLLKLLRKQGVSVLVLDHHNTMYSYEDFEEYGVLIINTTIENKMFNGNFELSAGALCYTVMRALMDRMEVNGTEELAVYATISLYADCVSMLPSLNRSIYYEAKSLTREELPSCVVCFMNKYSSFNSRFIGFWFSPRVNSMFRSENLDLLNILFFKKSLSAVEESKCLAAIEEVYQHDKKLVDKVSDVMLSHVIELNNFVIADLYEVDSYAPVVENKLYNYTGLIANKLSSQFEKTAVVYCKYNNYYKGSVRDLYSRNYLSVFQNLCYAGGHNSAFGIKIRALNLDEFYYDLRNIDDKFSINGVGNAPIIIDYNYNSVDEALIHDVALYNEFAGFGLPVALLKKQVIGSIREIHDNYSNDYSYYRYRWEDFIIQGEKSLVFGNYVLLKPVISGKVKLFIQ